MNFYNLSTKNAWRKPVRTSLLIICIAVAFLIYGLSQSFINGSQGNYAASEDILGVTHASGRNYPLPLAYFNRISNDPDIAVTSYMTRLIGFVDKEKNRVAISAVEPHKIMPVSGKELGLTNDLVSTLEQTRNHVLVGRQLAEAQGWSIGQKVTVTSYNTNRTDGSHDWQFEISGIFNGENDSSDTYFMIARYDYINDYRASGKDTVSAFILRPASTTSPSELSARIDSIFANSLAPTRTQSEKQFLEAFLRQYADISLILGLVTAASFITLLLIIINTMVFAVRERTFEIGLLKTLGFTASRIVTLILSETLLIFVSGGSIGLILTKYAITYSGIELGLVFNQTVVAKSIIMIIVLGLISGTLPAITALRIPVINAFRTR